MINFLKGSDRNLHLALALATLVLTILVALTPFKEVASLILFLGSYIATTGPEWRSFFKAGGFATVQMPNPVTYMQVKAEKTTNSPRTMRSKKTSPHTSAHRKQEARQRRNQRRRK